jgi:hypothetical protein
MIVLGNLETAERNSRGLTNSTNLQRWPMLSGARSVQQH